MTTKLDHAESLTEKINHTEEKLAALEQEIAEIGEPAAHQLRKRLAALKIEEHALLRNFGEALASDEPNTTKLDKIRALLDHIEREESSLGHETDFLHQGAPSSVSAAMKGGAHLAEFGARIIKKILGDHDLGASAFVNQTHDSLARKYDLPDSNEEE